MLTLITIAAIVAAGYVAACAFWPFAACRWCSGTGKHRSPGGKAWRSCWRCDGGGRRVRVGRHLYEAVRGFDD